jgi:hypothetical protein
MSKHDYTPEQALRKLIEKLTLADSELATQVLAAVNAGKDVQETEKTGKRQTRFYRHTVPYLPEEALRVALEVLSAHFIEQPLFMNSCHDNMAKAALSFERKISAEDNSSEKTIEIELQPETAIIPEGAALLAHQGETQPMGRISEADIRQQQANLERLRGLIDFTVN